MVANFLSGIFVMFIVACIVLGFPTVLFYAFGYVQNDCYINKNTKFRIKKYLNSEGNERYKVQWKRFYHWHSVWVDDGWGDKMESIHSSETDAIDELNNIMTQIMKMTHAKEVGVKYSKVISVKDIIYGEKD